jgi:putative transposase
LLKHVELATAEWVDWCDHMSAQRIGDIPPAEFELNHHRQREATDAA